MLLRMQKVRQATSKVIEQSSNHAPTQPKDEPQSVSASYLPCQLGIPPLTL